MKELLNNLNKIQIIIIKVYASMVLLIGTFVPYYGQIYGGKITLEVPAGYHWIFYMPSFVEMKDTYSHLTIVLTTPNLKLIAVEFVVVTVIALIALFLKKSKVVNNQ